MASKEAYDALQKLPRVSVRVGEDDEEDDAPTSKAGKAGKTVGRMAEVGKYAAAPAAPDYGPQMHPEIPRESKRGDGTSAYEPPK